MRALSPALPNRLHELREAIGLTMAQLAKIVGTTPGQIWKLEKGRVKLTVEWMTKLAAALQCRPIDLLFDAPPPPTHINSEFLGHAIQVASDVLEIGLPPDKEVVLAEMVGQVYDVLVETVRERGAIGEDTIDALKRAHRRALAAK